MNPCCPFAVQVLVAQAGGIPPMVKLLEDGPLSARECAAGALWNLAMNDDNRVAIPEVRLPRPRWRATLPCPEPRG